MNLYLQTAKNSIVPLALAVFLPTFISYALVGKSVEKVIYESDREGLLSSNNASSTDMSAIFSKKIKGRTSGPPVARHEHSHFLEYAFEKAAIKTARYGSYLVIGLSNYPQVIELYVKIFKRRPNRMAVFFIGMWGGISWFFIPDDKIHAYNHWALTTMIDAALQSS
jgi:hypothetical protein